MNTVVYLLMVLCTHGEDNKQLLVDTFAFEKLEKCQAAEAVVKQELAKSCNQSVTKCQGKEVVK